MVLTQPMDMSHTLYQSKRFFCPQIVKRDSSIVRQTHYQQKFQKQTPRQAKQEWINRATAVRFNTHRRSTGLSQLLGEQTLQTLTVNKLSLMKKGRGVKVLKEAQRTPERSPKPSVTAKQAPSVDDSVEGLRDVSATEQIKTPKLEPSHSEYSLQKQMPQSFMEQQPSTVPERRNTIYDKYEAANPHFSVTVQNRVARKGEAES